MRERVCYAESKKSHSSRIDHIPIAALTKCERAACVCSFA